MPRKRKSTSPPVELVKATFSYDPVQGEVTRSDGNRGWMCQKTGYRRFSCPWKETVTEHRLAWCLYYGDWPDQQIDHINCNRGDNRLCNLRLVSAAQNAQNRRSANSTNKTGLLGVNKRWRGKSFRYEARIRANGIDHRLGWFESAELAHAAYLEAKRSLHQ